MWQQAKEAIRASSKNSSVYIGCDSQILGNGKVDYSTVIVLHMNSKNGCKVFHNSVKQRDYGNLRARLMTEVQYALEAFGEIEDALGERKLEIHLDINPDPKYASNVVTAEAIGWVRSLGLVAKVKPESFAATSAADHFVRHKSS
jgi:predicted RNase H-related nuclease YkuK (DUF458 family)